MEEKEKKLIEKIKTSYEGKKASEGPTIEDLKKLDKKVKTPANVFAYTFGTVSALVFGTGMSIALGAIVNIMWLGCLVGCVGIIMSCLTYPVYKAILKSRKKKYSGEILETSNKLLNQ